MSEYAKTWYEHSRHQIRTLTRDFPSDMPFKERQKRLRDAYPYGSRSNHPYKSWCKAQREYLDRYRNLPPAADSLFALPDSKET